MHAAVVKCRPEKGLCVTPMHPGDLLDGYTILRLIGRGGFGEVWLCRSGEENAFWALKFIPAARPDHLEKEIEALTNYRNAELWQQSSSLVPIKHAGRNAEGFYYVMPLADGTGADPADPDWRPLTLSALIEGRRGAENWFSSEEIAQWMGPVLDALQCLTDAGLVHRDVKPENILFFGGQPVLGDIGLLHEDDATLSRRGTPGYLTPSWYEAGHPDMYGVAATLYTLLTGNSPDRLGRSAFNAPPQGDASLSASERVRRKQLLAVVRRATDERPAERYRDFLAMKQALAGNLKHGRPWKRIWAGILVVAGVVAAAAGFTGSVPGISMRGPFVQDPSRAAESIDAPERWRNAIQFLPLVDVKLVTARGAPGKAAPWTLPRADEGFVLIPEGSFFMGNSFSADGEMHELPRHEVQVSAFRMQTTEVTNEQMVEVLNWGLGKQKVRVTSEGVMNAEGDSQLLVGLNLVPHCRLQWVADRFAVKPGKSPGHPCIDVTWYGACVYCNFRSEMEGLTPCYNLVDWSWDLNANGYRLPTEAEWEKAARGGREGTRFPWAEETIDHTRANYFSTQTRPYDANPARGYHPDYAKGDFAFTSPVGSFPPNGYGLRDMAGNVWEWCQDWFSVDSYSSSPSSNPVGPDSGTERVTRGGSWSKDESSSRVACREHNLPLSAYYGIGFRPVRR